MNADNQLITIEQKKLTKAYSHQSLKGQVAIVTGASSGIGEGVVRHLAGAGVAVVINYVTGVTLFVDGGMTLYPGFATGG